MDVDSGGKKREVKMGVEKMFDVKVDSVKMMKYKGKKKGMGG
ncbi:50S ribosomal protein L23 [Staphylococcus auricularis]|nr:50S ribosomal protein L23 [Staphylococcus auricularis]